MGSETVPTTLETLSLEQKIGQVLIWSFGGTEFSKEMERTLTKYQPGSFIVFRRNISSNLAIAKLNDQIQTRAKALHMPPLFLMVDQEGGVVTRVSTATPMPSALALAKMGDREFIERYAHASGDVLVHLGFNVDLAPVLDISDPKLDSFIGNRTFGNDPTGVAELTLAYSKGLAASGLIPTAKHFPGHGGTLTDSHLETPKKSSTLEELQSRDLVPFLGFASAEFPRAMMMAHLSLPNIDPSGLPATYSKVMIQDRLRQAMSYQGLVMTDDLEMSGASISKDIGERAVRAFLAGNDMMMLAGSWPHQQKAFEALLAATKSGRISEERLNESVARILAAKGKMASPQKPNEKATQLTLQTLDDLSKEVLKHNFKEAAETAGHKWPEVRSDTHVLLFGANSHIFKAFTPGFKGKTKTYLLTPKSLERVPDTLTTTASDFAVFFATGSKTGHWLNTLDPELKAKLVVVNCNNSGEIEDQDAFMAVLNVNSYVPESAEWLAELLNGKVELRQPAAESNP